MPIQRLENLSNLHLHNTSLLLYNFQFEEIIETNE